MPNEGKIWGPGAPEWACDHPDAGKSTPKRQVSWLGFWSKKNNISKIQWRIRWWCQNSK